MLVPGARAGCDSVSCAVIEPQTKAQQTADLVVANHSQLGENKDLEVISPPIVPLPQSEPSIFSKSRRSGQCLETTNLR